MKKTGIILWTIGIILLLILLFYQGMEDIVGTLVDIKYGLLVIALFHAIPLMADTMGWRELFLAKNRPSFFLLLWNRWICEAINSLLPVMQIGGDVVRARSLTFHNISGTKAGASVIVDITASVATQILFSFLGVFFLLHNYSSGGAQWNIIVGLAIFSLLLFGFYQVQRRGMFSRFFSLVERFVDTECWKNVLGNAKDIDQEINQIYGRKQALLYACFWRFLGWIVGAGEVWLILYFLGHRINWKEALMLESIGQAIRSSAFMIPSAYGVQEGGYMLLSSFIGLDAQTGLALSLSKRARECIIGLPALLLWYRIEKRD